MTTKKELKTKRRSMSIVSGFLCSDPRTTRWGSFHSPSNLNRNLLIGFYTKGMKNIDAGLAACGYITQDSIFNCTLSHKKMYHAVGKYQLLSNIPLTTFSWRISAMYLDSGSNYGCECARDREEAKRSRKVKIFLSICMYVWYTHTHTHTPHT